MPPEAYTYSEPNAFNPFASSKCLIRIYPATSEITILGEPFFENYAVQFNYDKSTIGFAVNAYAAPGTAMVTTALLWWEVTLIVIGSLVGLILIFFLINKLLCKSNTKE